MQHLPQPNNMVGRLFTDRRCNNNSIAQCLKCPRCDSSNTKFCYYNNYNLSQPRHFCKNCRRYWTKGGVLRNVPVGGGCRKSKRSSKPKQKRPASPGLNPVQQSRSSSESSSNVNVNAAVRTLNGDVFRVLDGKVEDFSIRNSGENQDKPSRDGNNNNNDNNSNNTMLLSGEFMNLITNENNQFCNYLSNNFQNLQPTSFNQFLQTTSTPIGINDWSSGVHQVEKDKISDLTVTIEDLLDNRGDWQNPTAENGSQGLFDFTSTVDHQNYWSQPMSSDDWSHNANSNVNDLPLFLP